MQTNQQKNLLEKRLTLVYNFIIDYLREHNHCPRKGAVIKGLGIKDASITYYLNILQKNGYIIWERNTGLIGVTWRHSDE